MLTLPFKAAVKERKDELWQNSLGEHELYHIEKVNEWLATGRLHNVDGKYRHITVKRLPMQLDLQAGAAFVNAPTFLRQLMAYGYEQAAIFLQDQHDSAAWSSKTPTRALAMTTAPLV